MKRSILVVAFLIGCAVPCFSRPVCAQQNFSSRPTISPYLNLFRRDAAAVDNYNAFVRPELELRSAMGRQQAALTRQATDIFSLQQHATRYGAAGAARGARTTSVFMNLGHYYPSRNAFMPQQNVHRRR